MDLPQKPIFKELSKMSKNTPVNEVPVKEQVEVTAPAFKFTVLKNVTLPLLKPALDVQFFVRINEAMFTGKKVKQVGGKDMDAAELCNVTNLETGESMQLIIPAVLQGIFADDYADAGYVGKCFAMTKHPKQSGKGYHAFSVSEISV